MIDVARSHWPAKGKRIKNTEGASEALMALEIENGNEAAACPSVFSPRTRARLFRREIWRRLFIFPVSSSQFIWRPASGAVWSVRAEGCFLACSLPVIDGCSRRVVPG